ncbi:MAG TPA: sulfotransferase [Caulobacteraceae bacterium]|jgi:tetratricopeptide (TPR) repeat protein
MTTPSAKGGGKSDSTASRNAQMARLAQTDLPKAKQMALKARAQGLRSAIVHHLVAMDLRDAGRFADAIAELGLGLELAPRSPGLMVTIGRCLLDLNRREEAAKVFETAMRLNPNLAEAAYGYGCAAERLGALDSARSAFERAVKLDPNHPDALAGLAGLATRRGDWALARTLAERSLAINERQTDALLHLARVDLGEEAFDDARVKLERIVELPFLKPLAHANARIILGDALDGLGRHRDAFDAYAAGNGELNDLYASEFRRPDMVAAPDAVRDMLAEFIASPAESWTAPLRSIKRGPERGHAFLMGFPRSGTTLLEQVIATHPDMAALGERPVMMDAEAEFLSKSGGLSRLAAVLSEMLQPYRDAYWRRVSEFGGDPAGKVFVDKHPLGAIRLPLIHKLFPAAKVIFALRDPRDVVVSCFRRSVNANAYELTTLTGTARFYDAMMTAAETYFERLPIAVHRLRHEALVADFETETRRLCDFLGVEWTPALGDFADTKRTIATPSSVQIRKGLYAESAGQWRNYAFALEPVREILAPWIERYGYPPD